MRTLALLATFSTPALAAEDVRIGIFVGNDEGGASQQRLRFASSDAQKMRDVFIEYGGIDKKNAILLQNENSRKIEDTLTEVKNQIRVGKASGHHTVLVFFYSGHGDANALNIGARDLEHERLRELLELTGADVRVAMLDACQSGAAVRTKGGTRGPSYAFDLKTTAAKGTAFLTSSARDEFSQESSELAGGFFTHYLASGLQGAADVNGDGDVGLGEVYEYVYSETAFATRRTTETQTPTFDFDLTGSGDLWLTRLEAASSWLVFDGGMPGAYSVWDENRKRYVAEVNGAEPARIALRPGTYYVHHRMPGWVDEAEFVLADGDSTTVGDMDFMTLAYEDTAARGDIEKLVRKANRPDVAVRLAGGIRQFSEKSTYNRQYFPKHNVAGIDVRVTPLTGHLYFGGDVLSGGRGAILVLPEVPDKDVWVQSTSVGAAFGAATGRNLVRAGIGLKAEAVVFSRRFDSAGGSEAISQGTFAIAPGLNTWVGVSHGRFVWDLNWNLMVLPTRWDDAPRSPAYTEFVSSIGWRF